MTREIKLLRIVIRSHLIKNDPELIDMYETICPYCKKPVEDHENPMRGTRSRWHFYHNIYKTSCVDKIKIMWIEFERLSSPTGFGSFYNERWVIKK